jgi:hypothetical protein
MRSEVEIATIRSDLRAFKTIVCIKRHRRFWGCGIGDFVVAHRSLTVADSVHVRSAGVYDGILKCLLYI